MYHAIELTKKEALRRRKHQFCNGRPDAGACARGGHRWPPLSLNGPPARPDGFFADATIATQNTAEPRNYPGGIMQATAGGGDLIYTDEGHGPPIVLVHGFPL